MIEVPHVATRWQHCKNVVGKLVSGGSWKDSNEQKKESTIILKKPALAPETEAKVNIRKAICRKLRDRAYRQAIPKRYVDDAFKQQYSPKNNHKNYTQRNKEIDCFSEAVGPKLLALLL